MKNNIDVFYTGGGIWLSAMYTSKNIYYVVDNDYIDCLTKYNHENEDNDTEYACQNMIYSKDISELNEKEKAIFESLKKELVSKMF